MEPFFNCGDSLGPEGIASLADKSVSHVITDPPFTSHVHGGNRRGWEIVDGVPRPTRSMPMAFDALEDDELPMIATQLTRVCSGWIIVFCAIEQVGAWSAALVAAGAKKRNTCVWTKSNAAPKFQGDGPAAATESFVTAWAGKGHSVWNAGGSYGHYHYPVDNGLRVERRHETQKPLPLIRQILLDFTAPGDVVLDPFAGGGSTPIGCKQLGRVWAAWELDPVPHARAAAALARAVPLSAAEVQAFHRRRKDRAYAGLAPKPTALPMQADFDFGMAGRERDR